MVYTTPDAETMSISVRFFSGGRYRTADALETAPPGVLPPIRTRQDVPRMVETLRAEIERANAGRPTKFLQPITAKQRERGEGWALLLLGG